MFEMNEDKPKTRSVYRFTHGINDIEHIKSDGVEHTYNVYSPAGEALGSVTFKVGDKMDKLRNEDLLEIVRARLVAYNAGKFSNRATQNALTHVEEALLWLCRRGKSDNDKEDKQ